MSRRKRMTAIAVLAVAVAIGTAGCQNVRETAGALGGAGIGAIVGSKIGGGSGKTVATVLGAAAGAWVGREIGRKLDEQARMRAAEARAQALNTASPGHTIAWEAPNSDGSGGPARGTETVTKQGMRDDGRTCREIVSTLEVDGQQEEVTHVLCRQDPSEEWKLIET